MPARKRESGSNGAQVRYMVLTWAPEEVLEEWNEWHTNVHIPNVLKTPQMRGAHKYRISEAAFPGDLPWQYVTIYLLDSLQDFQAYRKGPGVALRKEHDSRWGDVVKVARIVVCEDQRIL